MTTTDITDVAPGVTALAVRYRDQLEDLIGPGIDNVGRVSFAAAKAEATMSDGQIDYAYAYLLWGIRLRHIIEQLETP